APAVEQSVVGGGSQYNAGRFNRPSADPHPRIVTHDTNYGFRYGALRKTLVDPDKFQYVRTTLFVAPLFCFVPGRRGSGDMQAFVPVDSEHSNFFYAHYDFDGPVDEAEFRAWVGVQKG